MFLSALPLISSCVLSLRIHKVCFVFCLLSSMRADEPRDPRAGYIYGLCSCKCPAVSDRCNAHPPPLHSKKWGWRTPYCLSAQPEPRRRELHTGCTATCSNQRRPAHSCLWTALAEVHHLLRERLRWVGKNESTLTTNISHKHDICM